MLGCILESSIDGHLTAGRIVEVEAYIGPKDPAAHSFGNRKTERNASMFGPAGTAYVYLSYGVHWCVNLVTERTGFPTAVLVRALQPLVGLDPMRQRRGEVQERVLCAGPGRLCQALGITRELDGADLQRRPLRVLRPGYVPKMEVGVSGRVGVSKAADWPLRFYVAGSPWLTR